MARNSPSRERPFSVRALDLVLVTPHTRALTIEQERKNWGLLLHWIKCTPLHIAKNNVGVRAVCYWMCELGLSDVMASPGQGKAETSLVARVAPTGPAEGLYPPAPSVVRPPVVPVKAVSLGDLTSGQKRRQLFRAGCLCKETHYKVCLEQRVRGVSAGAGLASEDAQ